MPNKVGRDKALPRASVEILATLAAGEQHGYGIKHEVEERTDGVVRLAAGTLYAALDRLSTQGWIEALDERPDSDLGSTRWRYFRITTAGRVALNAEITRLEKLVRTVRALDLTDPETS